jgi:hypothetical protein
MTMKSRIIKSHEPSFDYQVWIESGELLSYERKESDSAGWIWCKTSQGESCWIPENWVEIDGNHCVMHRDYNSRELTVTPGEIVQVDFVESGWAWITTAKNESGWIPETCLKRD